MAFRDVRVEWVRQRLRYHCTIHTHCHAYRAPPRVGFVLPHSLNLVGKNLSYLEAMTEISLGSVRMVTPGIYSGGDGR